MGRTVDFAHWILRCPLAVLKQAVPIFLPKVVTTYCSKRTRAHLSHIFQRPRQRRAGHGGQGYG